MLKAASVPQQLTPLLQDAACQVDGISRLLLPVTQSRRGTQTVFALLFCLQSRAGQAMSYKGGQWKRGSSVGFVQEVARQSNKFV